MLPCTNKTTLAQKLQFAASGAAMLLMTFAGWTCYFVCCRLRTVISMAMPFWQCPFHLFVCTFSCCFESFNSQLLAWIAAAINHSMYASQAVSAVCTCTSVPHAFQIKICWFISTRIWKIKFWHEILGIAVRCAAAAAAAKWLRGQD